MDECLCHDDTSVDVNNRPPVDHIDKLNNHLSADILQPGSKRWTLPFIKNILLAAFV